MSHKFFPKFRSLSFIVTMIAGLLLSACAPGPERVLSTPPTPSWTETAAASAAPTATVAFTAVAPIATLERDASSLTNCSSLRSIEGSVSTSITFVNQGDRAINVYWVDYQGAEQFYFELQPGQSQTQDTYVTHPWCARDKTSNAPLLAVVATKDELVAAVPGDLEWQETLGLPLPFSAPFDSFRGQQLVFHSDHVYILGGRSATQDRLQRVFFSAIKPDGTVAEWNTTTPLPGTYYDHVAVQVGDYVYLITGADGSEDVYFAPFQPDGSIGAWRETAPLSPSRQTFAAASYGNFIYATGGNSGGTQNFVQYTSVKADGSLNPWAYTTPLPEPVQEHPMIAYDGHLYVIGGRKKNDAWHTTVYFSAIKPDGTLAEWKTTTPLPRELHGAATFAWNGYVYLLSSDDVYYTHILEDHAFGEWRTTTSLPGLRNGLRVGAHNGYAYAMGGSDLRDHQRTVYYGWLGGIAASPDCTSGWTRLRSGSYAEVSQDQPEPNRIREAPDTNAKMIYQVYPGTILHVVEGPVCTNGLVFWKVENALIPGGTGWTAEGDGQEYYLEPTQ